MNITTIIGNLVRDPEYRTVVTKQGETMSVLNFTVASDYTRQNGEKKTTYTKAALWNEKAEAAKDALKKGSFVKIQGAVEPETFVGRDGQTRTATAMHGTRLALWHNDNPEAQTTRGFQFI